MRIGCVVKAAGKSVRLGRNKLLEDLDGRPILVHTLGALPKERFACIVAVVSSPKVARLCERHSIRPLLYEGGPVSQSIRLGLREMTGMDGCLFVSGDQPLCLRTSYERLLDAFERDPNAVVRLRYQGTAGSPVLFPARLFPRLAALEGEHGGMSIVSREEICYVEANDAAELWDVDTEVALQQVRVYWQSGKANGR